MYNRAVGPNRIFFPAAALDAWLGEGKIDLAGEVLTILVRDEALGGMHEARKYRIVEAARVLREVTGSPDVNELEGRVKSRLFLTELGADLVESSMVLGDNAYDVVPGFVGTPIGSFAEQVGRKAGEEGAAAPAPASDEDLLARFLRGL